MFPLRLSFPSRFPFPLRLSSPLIFPVPVNVSFPVKVIVPVVISLQKPCQSVRAFPDDPENYENF